MKFNPIYKMLLMLILGFATMQNLHSINWVLNINAQNTNPSGANLIDSFRIGENEYASDGYDLLDWVKNPAPSASNYIYAYVKQTTWGANNGYYFRDIRSSTAALKTWNAEIYRANPFSNSYTVSWELPSNLPPYYTIQLIRGSTTINMRNQNSYTFTASSTITFQIKVSPTSGVPFIAEQIPEQLFSNNLLRRIAIAPHFVILNSPINYSLANNPLLVQSLVTINDTLFWQFRPQNAWIGTTYSSISATGSSGNVTMNISITRDSTNSPPYYIDSGDNLHILQNQSLTISLANRIFDDDLDNVSVSIASTDFVDASYDPIGQSLLLSPVPGFKGACEVFLMLDDTINEPQAISLPLVVDPSQAKAVSQISLSTLFPNQNLLLTWDPVTEDINDLPLTNLLYRIDIYAENPEYQSEAISPVETILVSDTFYELSAQTPKKFIIIKVINE